MILYRISHLQVLILDAVWKRGRLVGFRTVIIMMLISDMYFPPRNYRTISYWGEYLLGNEHVCVGVLIFMGVGQWVVVGAWYDNNKIMSVRSRLRISFVQILILFIERHIHCYFESGNCQIMQLQVSGSCINQMSDWIDPNKHWARHQKPVTYLSDTIYAWLECGNSSWRH